MNVLVYVRTVDYDRIEFTVSGESFAECLNRAICALLSDYSVRTCDIETLRVTRLMEV